MTTTSPRVRRKPASAIETDSKGAPQVIGWVRERIRHGQLVPGQRLVEADIVASTGASRSKVREALQRLESEGLVTLEEFRGASVKKFGPDEIEQIYRARMALEGLAASECALRGGDALKRELSALQQQMDEGAQEGDHARFARLNDAWHRLIISGSGNEYVAQFLGRLTVPIYRLLFSSFYPAQRIRAANADHRVITAAIVEGRAEDAERAMRDHIRQGLAALTELNAHLEA